MMPFSVDSTYLEVRGLCKGYGENEARVEVLKGIDVALRKGEICVLLGPSGSGKSTFLDLVGGLEPADSGSIVVNDTELTALNAKQLGEYRRRELGFVFQFYNLVGNNSMLFKTTDIIETYVYRSMMNSFNFSQSSAVGLFQSVVGFFIVLGANAFVKHLDPDYALF